MKSVEGPLFFLAFLLFLAGYLYLIVAGLTSQSFEFTPLHLPVPSILIDKPIVDVPVEEERPRRQRRTRADELANPFGENCIHIGRRIVCSPIKERTTHP